jgi:hypothetical protein
MKHQRGDVKILLSVEHGLTRRRDVNDAIRIAVENDIDAAWQDHESSTVRL